MSNKPYYNFVELVKTPLPAGHGKVKCYAKLQAADGEFTDPKMEKDGTRTVSLAELIACRDALLQRPSDPRAVATIPVYDTVIQKMGGGPQPQAQDGKHEVVDMAAYVAEHPHHPAAVDTGPKQAAVAAL